MIGIEIKIDRGHREAVLVLYDAEQPKLSSFAMRLTADELERFGNELLEGAAKVRAALAS